MKVVAIIQARMGSERLPGKVLADIGGKTMLARVVERTARIASVDEVVVATTEDTRDDAIADACRALSVPVFRGSEADVLDRYYQAAKQYAADAVMRITADCPLLDPEVSGNVLNQFLIHRPDYASNSVRRTYPRGLDTGVMSLEALERTWREATRPYQREHVTIYMYEHPENFRLLSVESGLPINYSHYRWTVDTPEDLQFVRAVYDLFPTTDEFGWLDVIEALARRPDLVAINRHVKQKPSRGS